MIYTKRHGPNSPWERQILRLDVPTEAEEWGWQLRVIYSVSGQSRFHSAFRGGGPELLWITGVISNQGVGIPLEKRKGHGSCARMTLSKKRMCVTLSRVPRFPWFQGEHCNKTGVEMSTPSMPNNGASSLHWFLMHSSAISYLRTNNYASSLLTCEGKPEWRWVCQLFLPGIPGALVYKAALESLNLDSPSLPAQILPNLMLLTFSRNCGHWWGADISQTPLYSLSWAPKNLQEIIFSQGCCSVV